MDILDNFLSWIIFGSVIGSIAYILEPDGFRGNNSILLGILGAVLTGIIANVVLNIPFTQFSFVSLMVALCGACLLIVGGRTLRSM